MFLQISLDYAALPDPRSLTEDEVIFYYDGLRHSLKKHTKPKTDKTGGFE